MKHFGPHTAHTQPYLLLPLHARMKQSFCSLVASGPLQQLRASAPVLSWPAFDCLRLLLRSSRSEGCSARSKLSPSASFSACCSLASPGSLQQLRQSSARAWFLPSVTRERHQQQPSSSPLSSIFVRLFGCVFEFVSAEMETTSRNGKLGHH